MLITSGPPIFPWRRKSTVVLRQSSAPPSSAGSTGRGSTGGSWRALMTWSSSTRYSFYNKLKMDAFYLVLVFEYTFLVSNCVTTCLTYNYIFYIQAAVFARITFGSDKQQAYLKMYWMSGDFIRVSHVLLAVFGSIKLANNKWQEYLKMYRNCQEF